MGSGKGKSRRALSSTPRIAEEVNLNNIRIMQRSQREAAISAGAGEISHSESHDLYRRLVEMIQGSVTPGMTVENGDYRLEKEDVKPHARGSVVEVNKDGMVHVDWGKGKITKMSVIHGCRVYRVAEEVETQDGVRVDDMPIVKF